MTDTLPEPGLATYARVPSGVARSRPPLCRPRARWRLPCRCRYRSPRPYWRCNRRIRSRYKPWRRQGEAAMPSGVLPTGIVAVTVPVAPLITATLFAPASATYTVEGGGPARATPPEVANTTVVTSATATPRQPPAPPPDAIVPAGPITRLPIPSPLHTTPVVPLLLERLNDLPYPPRRCGGGAVTASRFRRPPDRGRPSESLGSVARSGHSGHIWTSRAVFAIGTAVLRKINIRYRKIKTAIPAVA